MKENATIADIRKIRKKISERFGFDPKRLVAFYKDKQKKRMSKTVEPHVQ